ncbi:NYN domain-containing protein [Rugosimonospora acidiphila]|uniref:NYN domain-containing protein n=1 Tax=Rugosimonospora acidiphila TaxID=556531 RepID=A0ABP9RPX9_9ACTN
MSAQVPDGEPQSMGQSGPERAPNSSVLSESSLPDLDLGTPVEPEPVGSAAGESEPVESDLAESELAESELTESGLTESELIELGQPEPTLPEAVRQRVISAAAGVLTHMPIEEVPTALRRVARFAPARRARLGGTQIAAQLAGDPVFRQRVGARVAESAGELGEAVSEGVHPAAADPVEIAALAYLIRPAGWLTLVEAAGEAVRAEADSAAVTERVREAEHRIARAEHDRAVARVEADKLRDELARLREEASGLRDENRMLHRAQRELQAREKRANELLATERGRVGRQNADHDAEVRRLRARLAEAEAAIGANRQTAKEARQVDDARLWLLLETIGQAAAGLRRELALEPSSVLPADVVADEAAVRPGSAETGRARGLDADDPVRLDQLLALPKAHLIVDGYNVTKTGFPEISLEQQRNRLVSGLGGIAAQTGAEVTVVFDGSERMVGLPPAPRGVRVLFSRKGETADELIRRLVRAEPVGRPVVVISTDREVADGVRRHGAYPLGSPTLLRRLARG